MNQIEFWETNNLNDNYVFIVNSKLLEKCNYFYYMHRHCNKEIRQFFWEKKGPLCLINISNANAASYLPDAYLKSHFYQ